MEFLTVHLTVNFKGSTGTSVPVYDVKEHELWILYLFSFLLVFFFQFTVAHVLSIILQVFSKKNTCIKKSILE